MKAGRWGDRSQSIWKKGTGGGEPSGKAQRRKKREKGKKGTEGFLPRKDLKELGSIRGARKTD